MGVTTVDASGGGIGRVYGFGSTPGKVLSGTFTFSSSYPTGGEEFDVSEYFKELRGVIFEPRGGYTFSYDMASKKVVAHDPSVKAVSGEYDVTDNALALDGLVAAITAVQATEGTKTGPLTIVLSGEPATGQVKVNGKNLTFFATDAVTKAKVSYAQVYTQHTYALTGANLSTLGAVRWFAWGS